MASLGAAVVARRKAQLCRGGKHGARTKGTSLTEGGTAHTHKNKGVSPAL